MVEINIHTKRAHARNNLHTSKHAHTPNCALSFCSPSHSLSPVQSHLQSLPCIITIVHSTEEYHLVQRSLIDSLAIKYIYSFPLYGIPNLTFETVTLEVKNESEKCKTSYSELCAWRQKKSCQSEIAVHSSAFRLPRPYHPGKYLLIRFICHSLPLNFSFSNCSTLSFCVIGLILSQTDVSVDSYYKSTIYGLCQFSEKMERFSWHLFLYLVQCEK